MTPAGHRARRRIASASFVLAALLGGTAWVQASPAGTVAGAASTRPKGSKPLKAPKTSLAQDTKFFTYVTEADPALVTYEQKQGNVALRALLTDGSAFCALLQRGGGIDAALVAEADGARSTEAQTSLPLSVTTFNTIESVSLLTLCPSEQKLVPASDRSRIRNLGDALAKRPAG
ncbi:MAG TPA: hypothetical protein VGG09_05440 [Acidimicrobiales bacterium]